MAKYVAGIENEYAIRFEDPVTGRTSRYSPDNVGKVFLTDRTTAWLGPNQFLYNGARLYVDVGAHPEYATPECLDPLQVTTYDRAGEEIMRAIADMISTDERITRVIKNNGDGRATHGCHENYQAPLRGSLEKSYNRIRRLLVPFLVIRPLWAGAGDLDLSCETTKNPFVISQRGRWMDRPQAGSSTQSRGYVLTRNQPLADEHKYWRIQVISGDSNLNEYATWLKVGTAMLVIQAIYNPKLVWQDVEIATSAIASAASAVDHVYHTQTPITLNNGQTIGIFELANYYLSMAAQHIDKEGIENSWENDILDAWASTLAQLERDPFTLGDRVDWVNKWNLLQEVCTVRSISWHNHLIRSLNIHQHELTKGLPTSPFRSSVALRVCDPQEVKEAILNPPSTRAQLRSVFLHHAAQLGVDICPDWDQLKIIDSPTTISRKVAALPDPTCTDPELIADALDALDAHVRARNKVLRNQGLHDEG